MTITSRLKKSRETTAPLEPPKGREELAYWHGQLAEAIADVADHEAGLARLQAAIEAGSRAEASAVGALLANRGAALDRETTMDRDYQIAHGRIAEKALPRAEEELATARAEVDRLRTEVVAAAKRQLLADADAVVSEYNRKLAETHAVYDLLIGIRGALIGEAGMRPIEAPRFRLVPHAEIGIDVHGPVSPTGDPRRSTLEAQANWTKALDRLIDSPTADVSDLVE